MGNSRLSRNKSRFFRSVPIGFNNSFSNPFSFFSCPKQKAKTLVKARGNRRQTAMALLNANYVFPELPILHSSSELQGKTRPFFCPRAPFRLKPVACRAGAC